eukprot:gene1461-12080_t
MPILYGLVIKQDEVQGDYPSDKKKLRETIMEKIFPKLAPSDHRRTLTQKAVEFHYKKENGNTVFCVATEDTKKRVCWNFIEQIESEYNDLGRNPSKKKVISVISSAMKKWNDPSSDTINLLNEKVDNVKSVMIDNIDKVIDRGEKLEDLSKETDELVEEADKYRVGAKNLKNATLAKLVFLVILLVFIIIGIIVAAVFIGCDFPSFSRCGGNLIKPL